MATVANFATVQREGDRIVTRQVEYYNLDMILSVGYRVKSRRGIEFRRWASTVLKDYLLKDLGKKMFAFSKMDIPASLITDSSVHPFAALYRLKRASAFCKSLVISGL